MVFSRRRSSLGLLVGRRRPTLVVLCLFGLLSLLFYLSHHASTGGGERGKQGESLHHSLSQESLINNIDMSTTKSPSIVSTTTTSQNELPLEPFTSFSCLDQVPQGAAHSGPYARPFRFHVYEDMPYNLTYDLLKQAGQWWAPGSGFNQFTTEAFILKYLHRHPCHTYNPNEADAFIVPAQTVTAVWLSRGWGKEQSNTGDEGRAYMQEVLAWLQTKASGRRYNLLDHYAVSVPWWNDKRTWPQEGINLIGVENPIGGLSWESSTLGRWDYVMGISDITVPYPDPDAIAFFTDARLQSCKREATIVFVGSLVPNAPVREVAQRSFSAHNTKLGRTDAIWKDLSTDRADTHTVYDLVCQATFGAVFPGDSYSSRRLFTLIHANTIPVIICDRCQLAFSDFIDYSKFCIFLSEERLLHDPTYDIFDILKGISSEEIAELREQGLKVRRHLVYNEGEPQPGDVLDLLVRSMAMKQVAARPFKEVIARSRGEGMTKGN